MTFEEAKQRNDYEFSLYGIKDYINEIRNNWLSDYFDDGTPDIGAAVLKIGYVDIEVNVNTRAQYVDEADITDKTPVIGYFCCIKRGDSDSDWESDDYIDYEPQINWSTSDWKEQLEKDMFKALDMYVKANGYNYDKAN